MNNGLLPKHLRQKIEDEFWSELTKAEAAFNEQLRQAEDEYGQLTALEIHRAEHPTEWEYVGRVVPDTYRRPSIAEMRASGWYSVGTDSTDNDGNPVICLYRRKAVQP